MAKTARPSKPRSQTSLNPSDEAGWNRLARKYLFAPPAGHINLNAGTLSATPKPVFDAAQSLRAELAAEPSTFLWRKQAVLLQKSRAALAGYLGCAAGNLLLVPNATWAMNLAATAVRLRPGDEVLGTDHEYGACTNSWQRQVDEGPARGPKIVRVSIPYFPNTPSELVETIWSAVTARTRVLHLSHVNYTTGLIMPVEELCRRARSAGITTVVDGSHAPGAIPVKRAIAAADFYVANSHKWLMCPAGSGFLHARKDLRELVQPVITSWGYGYDPARRFTDSNIGGTFWQWNLEFHGTDDRVPQMVVPEAIAFRDLLGGDRSIWARTRYLSDYLRSHMAGAGFQCATPDGDELSGGSITAFEVADTALESPQLIKFRDAMYAHGIEAPATAAGGKTFLRVSTPWFVSTRQIDRLVEAAGKVYRRRGKVNRRPAQ